jgi:ribonuclease D
VNISLYQNDLPDDINLGNQVAIDSEAMGLMHHRDRLCVIQLSSGDGNAHLIQFSNPPGNAPTLKRLLTDKNVTKIFHFARFDVALIAKYLQIITQPIYCTKIASKLARTYTDRHGLKDLCREILSLDISKQQQSSDWGAADLSDAQKTYAAHDVLHLHELKIALDIMLEREGRAELARAAFEFLPWRARLDLAGWADEDIFAH